MEGYRRVLRERLALWGVTFTPEPTPEPTSAPTPEPAEIDGTALAEAISVMPRNDDYHEACNRFNAGERSPDLYAYVLARLDT